MLWHEPHDRSLRSPTTDFGLLITCGRVALALTVYRWGKTSPVLFQSALFRPCSRVESFDPMRNVRQMRDDNCLLDMFLRPFSSKSNNNDLGFNLPSDQVPINIHWLYRHGTGGSLHRYYSTGHSPFKNLGYTVQYPVLYLF